MRLNFWKRQPKEASFEKDDPIELFKEYVRLVNYGDTNEFLDIDSSLLVSYRDDIQDLLEKGEFDPDQREAIKQTDTLFKEKAKAAASILRERIKNNDPNSDYLKGILSGLTYDAKPKTKWWYHLID